MAQAPVPDVTDAALAVDAYVESLFTASDGDAQAVLDAQRAGGLPDIAVSPAQGKLLSVLARSIGARRAVEFGTLGGYSTLWLARAMGPAGHVTTFELAPEHAAVARASLDAAGVGDRVDIRVGPALDNLGTLAADEAYDFVFIDADKPSNLAYYEAAMTRVRAGALVIVDNVVRGGCVANADDPDDRVKGSRAVIERVAADARVEATVVQTVGAKFYDGMLVATVL